MATRPDTLPEAAAKTCYLGAPDNSRRSAMRRFAAFATALLAFAGGCATTTHSPTHHRPTSNGREEFERMILADEHGRIEPGALMKAAEQLKRMRALNPATEATGIWKTTNGGETWAPVDDFLANLAVSALAMSSTDPNTIYAGTGGGAGGSLL